MNLAITGEGEESEELERKQPQKSQGTFILGWSWRKGGVMFINYAHN